VQLPAGSGIRGVTAGTRAKGTLRPVQGETRHWYLWVDECPRPGWANMSIDLALLDRAELGEGWVRLYTWDPHCLSFGRHEPASRRYDVNRIRALGLDTVRRPTGGRAVWHAHELTYALAAPHQWFGSLRVAYEAIHRVLAAALGALGVPAALAHRGRTAALDSGPCFSQPAGGEVLVSDRKIIGSAQLRRGPALLQHGSILLEDAQWLVEDLLQDHSPAPASPARPERFVLANDAGHALSLEEVAAMLSNSARHHWPGDWESVGNPAPVLRAAASHFQQFRSSAWTWSR
jgi:lipoyl(octanoyl) transferase